MIISCNRIIFPPTIEEDDDVIREAKLAQAAKNIRKRKFTFHLCDVERIGQHEDTRFCIVWFYTGMEVIEYKYDELEKQYTDFNTEPEEDESLYFIIPKN